MSWKLLRRTLRNVVFRDRPYFAHLALTHRCNLRCRFCQIQEEKFEELDTQEMEQVIDVLDEMGVAVLSISGGGEPLLRRDCARILNYAAGKGLYTKLTSNGTMPLERYQELLESGVKEIAISLDGVRGNDLPFSHVGPKILQTIRYLNDKLPAGKQLTLNVTVTEANQDQVDEIVKYCARHFPNAKVWLNPVVVGSGKLRTLNQCKVKPDALRSCDSPTLLRAEFYHEAVEKQNRNGGYDWGCQAGRMFFDIKPNGDLWICQDQPARTRINILDPDFRTRFCQADFAYRRECSGCTYSCYYLTQKGFELRYWPQMAGLWWKANTHPDERCREIAARYGWLSGLLSFCVSRLVPCALRPVFGSVMAVMLLAGVLAGQSVPFSLDSEQILLNMEQSNLRREQKLLAVRSTRSYLASNSRFHREARITAEFEFDAPGTRIFRIVTRAGSRTIQRQVIEPLMVAEQSNGNLRARRSLDVCRRNYTFVFLGSDEKARAYVFDVAPRTPGRYLFRGRIWVSQEDFAIQRIEGEPAQSPSFWVKWTRFVHEYARFGEFWFPVRHRTEVDLRLFGRSSLAIDYSDYRWEETGQEARAMGAGSPLARVNPRKYGFSRGPQPSPILAELDIQVRDLMDWRTAELQV